MACTNNDSQLCTACYPSLKDALTLFHPKSKQLAVCTPRKFTTPQGAAGWGPLSHGSPVPLWVLSCPCESLRNLPSDAESTKLSLASWWLLPRKQPSASVPPARGRLSGASIFPAASFLFFACALELHEQFPMTHLAKDRKERESQS